MSKNIRGLTQAVVNVSQINFIDALFNTVTGVTINGTTAEITGTLTVNNLVITGTFTLTGGIDVDGVTTTTLTLTSIPQDNTDTINRNLLFIGADDKVHQHSTLNFNQSTQELRCQELVVNGDITGNVTGDLTGNVTATNITTANITATGLITGNVTGDLTGNVTATNITTANITATGTITGDVTGDLTGNVTGATNITTANITASGNTNIKALNNTTANFNNRIPFINGDSSDTGVLVSRGNFNYNTSTQTLNCGTFNGTLNGSVSNAVTIGTQDITVSGTTTINATDTTSTNELCRILFLDGDSNVGTSYDIVRATPLYYIPSSQMLVSGSLRGQVQLISPQLTLLGTTLSSTNASIGLYDDGTAVRNRYQHAGGHVFMDSSNNLLSTNTTQTRIYNELQCDDDVTITGTLTAGTLNIGTQTATNFSVTNNLSVGGDTTLSNVPTASGSTPLNILLLGGNKVQRGSITFNPLSNILSTTNVSLTGALVSSLITTTGNGTIGGNLVVTGNGSIGGDLTVTDDVSIGGDLTVGKQFIGSNTTLPLGYTIIYHATSYDSASSGTWGLDNSIFLYTTSSSGASPTVYQYGKDVTWTAGTTTLKGAIDFYSDVGTNSISSWGLMENKYAGLYRVRVSLVFQNESILRLTPKIYIQKRREITVGQYIYDDQPQISTGIDYARHDVGELVTLTCEGVVRLSSTVNLLRIRTLLESHTVNSPPTWPDSTTDWSARDINIDMQFLGEATNSTGEFIDAL